MTIEQYLDTNMPPGWTWKITSSTNFKWRITAKRPNNGGTYKVATSEVRDVKDFVRLCAFTPATPEADGDGK